MLRDWPGDFAGPCQNPASIDTARIDSVSVVQLEEDGQTAVDDSTRKNVDRCCCVSVSLLMSYLKNKLEVGGIGCATNCCYNDTQEEAPRTMLEIADR
jgi:hypothetical protein